MFARSVAALLIMGTLSQGAAADAVSNDNMSGNFYRTACRDEASKSLPMAIAYARCMELVVTVATLGPYLRKELRFCPAEKSTAGQHRLLFARFLDQNPARLHEPGLWLAVVALHEAWRCPPE